METLLILGGLSFSAALLSLMVTNYYRSHMLSFSDSAYKNWTLAVVGTELVSTGLAIAFCHAAVPLSCF